MKIVVFGANGATGLALCQQALVEGHQVIAAVRRPDEFPMTDANLTAVKADVMDAASLAPIIKGADAVCSTLGAPYSKEEISIYSASTRNIVAAMREVGVKRLIAVSSGLTYEPPKVYGFFMDRLIIPLLRNRFGKTLYADMRRMEEFLGTCDDIDWTIMRPAQLEDKDITDYSDDGDFPQRNFTSRAALAAAMLADLGSDAHIRGLVSPTTR